MMCCNLNISSLVVEIDAKAIVDVLGNSSYVNNNISPILDDCMLLASRIRQIRVKHCYHQANQCADSLARMSISQDLEFSSFDSLPMDMINIFENDLNGMYSNRICPEPLVVPKFALLNCLSPKKKKSIKTSHKFLFSKSLVV